MVKHIGRHGEKKVVILWREIPGEPDNCLVIYPQNLPTPYQKAISEVLESAPGQAAECFAEVLDRNLLPDGRNILRVLHTESLIKKLSTASVLVTPDAKSAVYLKEINRLISKMSEGTEAKERLARMDAQAGLKDPKKIQKIENAQASVLSNSALSQNLKSQAERMKQDAQGLLTEAKKLEEQAFELEKTTQEVSEAITEIKTVVETNRRGSKNRKSNRL